MSSSPDEGAVPDRQRDHVADDEMSLPSQSGGLKRILPALVASSVLGYGVQLVAPLLVSSADYVHFSAFWSCLFLGIMALSGVQNEIARSAAPGRRRVPVIRRYTAVVTVAAAMVGSALGGVLGFALDSSYGVQLAVASALGLSGYAVMAVLAGLLYGAHRWNGVALAIVADPLLRALLFAGWGVAVLAATVTDVSLAAVIFATVVPFVLATVWVWMWGGGRVVVRTVALEGTLTQLLGRSFHTVLAACALGFMASGQPLVIATVARDEDPALVAGVILVVVLVRAPLVSPMVALQSYLTVTFRDRPEMISRRIVVLSTSLGAITIAAAVVVALAAPVVVAAVLPAYVLPSATVLVASVVGAGAVGVQCIVGAAVLSVGGHRIYAVGWLVTAISVVIVALVPVPFEPRLILLLLAPVVVGLAVHLWGLWRLLTVATGT